jgi:hypothetical protein
MLLKLVPEISGITLRIHEESGIPQGQYGWWDTFFESIKNCGRSVEIDLHAKSLKQPLMDSAVRTGQPLKVSPKFAGEHVGLGYHQAAIRSIEMPKSYEINRSEKFDLGKGVRGFLRYGYGDLFQHGEPYEILYRVWPGTQRHLLWGDPVLAAGWSNAASFCGGVGMEWFEPLAFKGREGSGIAGGRNAYADKSLDPGARDWAKFEYTYRVIGRTLYSPETSQEVWQRGLRRDFGAGAGEVQIALHESGRLLPLVTQAYMPSSANQWYWPELYTHMQIVPGGPAPYYDSPEPLCFGTAEALDPQFFSTSSECARQLLREQPAAKYTPLEVADWLENSATNSGAALERARRLAPNVNGVAFRRMEEDVLIQNALGMFFALKMRAGVLYEIFTQSGDVKAGQLAVERLQQAREVWAAMAERARGVYVMNIAYGDRHDRRGHWLDRLPAIDADLKALRAKVEGTRSEIPGSDVSAAKVLPQVLKKQERWDVGMLHSLVASFVPAQDLNISFTGGAASVMLMYRHVNQAERWQSVAMKRQNEVWRGVIPGSYTDSPFPIQYYGVATAADKRVGLFPGLNLDLTQQPYFVLQQKGWDAKRLRL